MENSERPKCEKHKIILKLRRNWKDGSLAIVCPMCDIEAHSGGQKELALVAEKILGDDAEEVEA